MSARHEPLQRVPFSHYDFTPAEQWAALEYADVEVLVTDALLDKVRRAFVRSETMYLHHVVSVAFPQLPTSKSALRAIKRGDVSVGRLEVREHDALAPVAGACLIARVGAADSIAPDVAQRLRAWNAKSDRPEAQICVLRQDVEAGWAVVNKPVGMHCHAFAESGRQMTFQAYLPALLPPPRLGTHCPGPRVCHRLDFRVGGPLVVATSEGAMHLLKAAFEQRLVVICVYVLVMMMEVVMAMEYRAIVCGKVGEVGETFTVDAPLEDEAAETRVEVFRVVPCPHFVSLSELRLWPITGGKWARSLGAPIINEEPALFQAPVPAWGRKHGHYQGRGQRLLAGS